MIVKAVFHVKGRGIIAVLDDPPKGPIHVGAMLHQGERSWKIVGVDTSCGGPRSSVGVILKGDGDPNIGPIFL